MQGNKAFRNGLENYINDTDQLIEFSAHIAPEKNDYEIDHTEIKNQEPLSSLEVKEKVSHWH